MRDGSVFLGFVLGMTITMLAYMWASHSAWTCIYRSKTNTYGVIQQKGSSDTYFTVTTNSYQEYLQQEIDK